MKRHSILLKAAFISFVLIYASCSRGDDILYRGQTVSVTHVSLNKYSLIVYGTNGTLKARLLPDGATNKNISWSSDNTNVATVNSNGFVTGVGVGTATITVTTEDGGKTASCAIIVRDDAPLTLAEHLGWLQGNAQSGTQYDIELKADETIDPTDLSYSGKSNVDITLLGMGGERIISLMPPGALFTVPSGVTLTLGNNITLKGHSGNNAPLVSVSSGGNLVMGTGSKITSNVSNHGSGVSNYGSFTMNGGEISNNKALSGYDGGGGVFNYGNFTMNGGKISGNVAPVGGGVHCAYGIFTMNGGEISGNTASSGGGVCLSSNSSMYISNGTIYGSSETTTSLRNVASHTGASLSVPDSNTRAQYGIFNDSTWVSHGILHITSDTIRVVNGLLQ
jgi:hypothetical protein